MVYMNITLNNNLNITPGQMLRCRSAVPASFNAKNLKFRPRILESIRVYPSLT